MAACCNIHDIVVEIKKDDVKEDVKKQVAQKKLFRDVHFWGRKIPLMIAKSIFKYFDTDHNWSLDEPEFRKFLENYGMEDHTEEFLMLIDTDGTGTISWSEFQKWISTTNHFVYGAENADTRFEILVALCEKFESYDLNGEGCISVDEFNAVKNDWRYPVDNVALFNLVDKDKNRKVTFSEYYDFFFHPYMKKYYPTVFDETTMTSMSILSDPSVHGKSYILEEFKE